MFKILRGVFCLVVVLSVLIVSNKHDQARLLSYDNCLAKFNSNNMPLESREGFLSACMN